MLYRHRVATPMSRIRSFGVPLAIASACATAACSTEPPLVLPPAAADTLTAPLPAGTDGIVERVVDGDTLVVDGRRVRIIGIDTPETVKPGSEVECFGPEASAATTALLPAGTKVRLEVDVERQDRYGRDLAHVYRERDGVFVAAYLVREGFAEPLVVRPNTRHRDRLARLNADARRAGRGLWGACPDPHPS